MTKKNKNRVPYFKSFSEIKFKTWKWLWHGWIVEGALNVVCGDGGVGKSSLILSLLHNEVMGNEYPLHSPTGKEIYGVKGSGKDCIYIGEDDDYSNIPKGVFRHLGTKEGRIRFPHSMAIPKKDMDKTKFIPYTIAEDTEDMLEYCMKNKDFLKEISTIVVDPLTPMIRGMRNPNNSIEVREKLEILRRFTIETGKTVIGICHVSKGHLARDIADMLGGSNAIRDLSRNVLGVLKCSSQYPDRSVVVRVKSNRASLEGGWLFECKKIPLKKGTVDDFGNLVEEIRYVDFEELTPIKGQPTQIRDKYCKEPMEDKFKKEGEQRELKVNKCVEAIKKILKEKMLDAIYSSNLRDEVLKDTDFNETLFYRAVKLIPHKESFVGKRKYLDFTIKEKGQDDDDLPPPPF